MILDIAKHGRFQVSDDMYFREVFYMYELVKEDCEKESHDSHMNSLENIMGK